MVDEVLKKKRAPKSPEAIAKLKATIAAKKAAGGAWGRRASLKPKVTAQEAKEAFA